MRSSPEKLRLWEVETWLFVIINYGKILIDRGMSKTELIKAAKISTNAMAKLGKK